MNISLVSGRMCLVHCMLEAHVTNSAICRKQRIKHRVSFVLQFFFQALILRDGKIVSHLNERNVFDNNYIVK